MRATIQFDVELATFGYGLGGPDADDLADFVGQCMNDNDMAASAWDMKVGPVRVSIDADDEPVHFERGETHVLLDEPSPNAGTVTVGAVDKNAGALKVTNNSRAYEFEMALPKPITREGLAMVLADAFFQHGVDTFDGWVCVRAEHRPFEEYESVPSINGGKVP